MADLPAYLQEPPQPRDKLGRFKEYPVKRHRRPATAAEHARRVAWGRQWGAILSAHSKTYKRQGG